MTNFTGKIELPERRLELDGSKNRTEMKWPQSEAGQSDTVGGFGRLHEALHVRIHRYKHANNLDDQLFFGQNRPFIMIQLYVLAPS